MIFFRHSVACARLFASLLLAGTASAQTVFVCLGGKAKMPAVIEIPAPGLGWDYSAAAPVPGTHWNRLQRTTGINVTDPTSSVGAKSSGSLGLHLLDTANDIALVDPNGKPTKVRLNIFLEVFTLATDKVRLEPAIHSKSEGAIPSGLMESAWRIFLPKNSFYFSISGLVPDASYDLYLYASCVDKVSNPTGANEGARFTLDSNNAVPGSPSAAETSGGFSGSIYTFSPETNHMTPSPAGSTWTLLPVIANAQGIVKFSTGANASKRHFINGFQLVEKQL